MIHVEKLIAKQILMSLSHDTSNTMKLKIIIKVHHSMFSINYDMHSI